MFILQVNPLHIVATDQQESLVAIARSESLDVLSAFVQHCLSLADDGVTIKHYESTVQIPGDPTHSDIQCIKMFRKGSPLENYTTPVDKDQLIVDLGTLEQRIDDLTKELVERVTDDWGKILAGVLDLNSTGAFSEISQSDL